MKRYTPRTLIKYLIKEFSFSLMIFTVIFSSLIVLTTFIQEITFFQEKEVSDNFLLRMLLLTFIKSPTLIINSSSFIFLFAGIFFYVKFMKNNEIIPISLSGFSMNFITLVPGIFSFFLGIVIIIIFSPISSELSKYYESIKKNYSKNDNLIVMSGTGIWIKEKKNDNIYIIRADKLSGNDFAKLKNISIYTFNKNKFKERINGDNGIIVKNNLKITPANLVSDARNISLNNYTYISQINLENIKNYFINADTFSIWSVKNALNDVRKMGYFGEEIIIKFHKYLSLPFLLFAMIVLSTFFTIKMNFTFNNFIYAFLGILTGIIVYFFYDLSIAVGKSGKLPLILSVWMPVILINVFSIYILINNED